MSYSGIPLSYAIKGMIQFEESVIALGVRDGQRSPTLFYRVNGDAAFVRATAKPIIMSMLETIFGYRQDLNQPDQSSDSLLKLDEPREYRVITVAPKGNYSEFKRFLGKIDPALRSAEARGAIDDCFIETTTQSDVVIKLFSSEEFAKRLTTAIGKKYGLNVYIASPEEHDETRDLHERIKFRQNVGGWD